jgi:hypothetical protein
VQITVNPPAAYHSCFLFTISLLVGPRCQVSVTRCNNSRGRNDDILLPVFPRRRFTLCGFLSAHLDRGVGSLPGRPQAADTARSQLSIPDFGLVYPLERLVRATKRFRRRVESSDPAPNFDLLLAAVYVPKSNLSKNQSFLFTPRVAAASDRLQESLEAMIAHSPGKKDQPEGDVQAAAGRDYFRVNLARGVGGRHQCVICSTASGHLLVWRAGAPKEKELDAIVATLNSITPLPQQRSTTSSQSTGLKDDGTEGVLSNPDAAQPQRMKVANGVTAGLLIKRVNPVYPADARSAYIQGTVVLASRSARPATSRILSW